MLLQLHKLTPCSKSDITKAYFVMLNVGNDSDDSLREIGLLSTPVTTLMYDNLADKVGPHKVNVSLTPASTAASLCIGEPIVVTQAFLTQLTFCLKTLKIFSKKHTQNCSMLAALIMQAICLPIANHIEPAAASFIL